MTTALKTMSFNIRCDTLRTTPDDPDYWPMRQLILTEMLKRNTPHVLGVQELMFHQVYSVLKGLPSRYRYIGKPRDKSPYSEQCAILYDPHVLLPLNYGTFWLSDTPLVSGSITWNNKDARIVTWAHFFHRYTERIFTVANTHFDHISEESRQRSAQMLLQYFNGTETIILGDFNNSVLDSPSYEILSNSFNDALSIGNHKQPLYGTFNNYQEPIVNGDRIDWILSSKDLVVDTVNVNPFNIGGKYPSDHLPIEAIFLLD